MFDDRFTHRHLFGYDVGTTSVLFDDRSRVVKVFYLLDVLPVLVKRRRIKGL